MCVRVRVCKRHLLMAAWYLNTLLILRNLKTNWSGKVPFLASWFGQTNVPIQHFEFCENDAEAQKTIREYSSNLWPNWDTKFQWESKGSRAPKHGKECPVETTWATAFKAEHSYGKILIRLCLFSGSITFLSLVLQCPHRFCELSDIFPKKSFSASDTWFPLFKTKNLDW